MCHDRRPLSGSRRVVLYRDPISAIKHRNVRTAHTMRRWYRVSEYAVRGNSWRDHRNEPHDR
jgi:hypothetical protein